MQSDVYIHLLCLHWCPPVGPAKWMYICLLTYWDIRTYVILPHWLWCKLPHVVMLCMWSVTECYAQGPFSSPPSLSPTSLLPSLPPLSFPLSCCCSFHLDHCGALPWFLSKVGATTVPRCYECANALQLLQWNCSRYFQISSFFIHYQWNYKLHYVVSCAVYRPLFKLLISCMVCKSCHIVTS